MSSRKEERERLRQDRIAAERSSGGDRSRVMAGYFVAGLLGLAVLAGLVVVLTSGGSDESAVVENAKNAHIAAASGVFKDLEPDNREGTPPAALQFGDLEDSAKQAGCETHLGLEDYGNSHFTDENKKHYSDYETQPPASGDHYGAAGENASGPTADGAYVTTPPASRVVHSLEHGRVEIQYSPDLPDEQQLALKGVFDEDSGGMLMFPNPDMPYDVAVVAWTNYIGCRSYDPLFLDVVRNFRDTFRGNGPEPVPTDLGA